MGDWDGLAGHRVDAFFEGSLDGCFSYAREQTINWCGDLDDFTLTMSGEDQLVVLDVDGRLVLSSDCEGLNGLESEVGHGWVGALNSVSVALDWQQTTPYAVKLYNRVDEDLLPTRPLESAMISWCGIPWAEDGLLGLLLSSLDLYCLFYCLYSSIYRLL